VSKLVLKDFSRSSRYSTRKVKQNIVTFFADIAGFMLFLLLKAFAWIQDVVLILLKWSLQIKQTLWHTLWRKNKIGRFVILFVSIVFVLVLSMFFDFIGRLLKDTQMVEQLTQVKNVKANYNGGYILSEYGTVVLDFDVQDAFSFYTYYTVKKGDTLAGIAQRYGLKTETIMWANNLSKYSVLKIGQRLKIPLEDGVIHVVKKGDTLDKIAKKYKSTVPDILEANWLDSPDQINIGMELFVPEGTMPTQEVKRIVSRISSSSSKTYTTTPVYKMSCSSFPKFLTSWPVAGGGRISRGVSTYHQALDITYKSSSNMHPYILAAADGRVSFAGIKGCGYRSKYCGYAWTVVIDHGNGYSTLYAHLQANSLLVRTGQYVKAGQAIARMGNTGYTVGGTGIHLHFEVRTTGTWDRAHRYNPFCFFK